MRINYSCFIGWRNPCLREFPNTLIKKKRKKEVTNLSLIINAYSCIAELRSSVKRLISLLAFIRTAIAWLNSWTASSRCACAAPNASRYSLRSCNAISHWRIAAVHFCFNPLRSRTALFISSVNSSHCLFKRATSSCAISNLPTAALCADNNSS